ncbi:hypothetical protein EVAR_28761_1 [Eumeta japonica]|uniref:Uncharacterized protein n=1 Tax=Eumeta variegata TaxID=151549 RepID=A0A4C1VGC6_EUMVA|nr:hypothetical protein EVAR_28761_1 [Eumeta japonica]
MKSTLCVIVSLAAVALAQIQYEGESASVDSHPQLVYRMQRPRRDTTYAKIARNVGSGKATGELGQNDYGLYGLGLYSLAYHGDAIKCHLLKFPGRF